MRPAKPSRRHFMEHLAWGSAAMAGSACAFTHTMRAHAKELSQDRKAAILLWMGGGPSTIDLWDLKPDAPTGGEFKPISTSGDVQISEHLPRLAQQMHQLAVVRSMSTREADHSRGRYYLHTGFVPSPTVEHPGYGSVVARELAPQRTELKLPPFVSVGGGSVGPGFLGMAYAPFVVNTNGRVDNLQSDITGWRWSQRMRALKLIENSFLGRSPGSSAGDHAEVLEKTWALMTSQQRAAFRVDREPEAIKSRYGTSNFGQGCLMARRLVEAGVPFVEVNFGGWDNHSNIFPTLRDNRLPAMDQGMSALLEDLEQRGMLANTVVIWMGEFGRTPQINGNAGRDHFARAWSTVVGGGGLRGGIAVGATNEDGTRVVTDPYSSEDLMATVCKALGISLETRYRSRNGRPMRIANGGQPITELFV